MWHLEELAPSSLKANRSEVERQQLGSGVLQPLQQHSREGQTDITVFDETDRSQNRAAT